MLTKCWIRNEAGLDPRHIDVECEHPTQLLILLHHNAPSAVVAFAYLNELRRKGQKDIPSAGSFLR